MSVSVLVFDKRKKLPKLAAICSFRPAGDPVLIRDKDQDSGAATARPAASALSNSFSNNRF